MWNHDLALMQRGASTTMNMTRYLRVLTFMDTLLFQALAAR
jgi:hypothetical protein